MTREEEKRRTALDFQNTFESPSGIETLKALSKKCRENAPTYVDGNPYASAYNEGMRSVILYIRAKLEQCINIDKQTEAIKEKD